MNFKKQNPSVASQLRALRAGRPYAKAAIETSRQFTAQGKNVRYIRSMFLPEEARCMCLFEAPNPQLVKEVNDAAKLPYTRVVEAKDLTP